jgi:hypothetical protein
MMFDSFDLERAVDELRRDTAARVRLFGGASERDRELLVNVLARVPSDVRIAALEQCLFVSVGEETGAFYLPTAEVRAKWIIVLRSDCTDEDFETAVAHELAHLALRHIGVDVDSDTEKPVALIRQWGFTGMESLPLRGRPTLSAIGRAR